MSISAITIEICWLVIGVLYFIIGITAASIKVYIDIDGASMGRVFGYPHYSSGLVALALFCNILVAYNCCHRNCDDNRGLLLLCYKASSD